jgi:hypothetical protein
MILHKFMRLPQMKATTNRSKNEIVDQGYGVRFERAAVATAHCLPAVAGRPADEEHFRPDRAPRLQIRSMSKLKIDRTDGVMPRSDHPRFDSNA